MESHLERSWMGPQAALRGLLKTGGRMTSSTVMRFSRQFGFTGAEVGRGKRVILQPFQYLPWVRGAFP